MKISDCQDKGVGVVRATYVDDLWYFQLRDLVCETSGIRWRDIEVLGAAASMPRGRRILFRIRTDGSNMAVVGPRDTDLMNVARALRDAVNRCRRTGARLRYDPSERVKRQILEEWLGYKAPSTALSTL